MKEGDVFNWSWKDKKGDLSVMYWCMDRQCVLRDGKLYDTYNYNPYRDEEIFSKEGLVGEFTKVIDPEAVNLIFKCNIHDVEELDGRDSKYLEDFEQSDVFSLDFHKGYKKLKVKKKGVNTSIMRKAERLQKQLEEKLREINYLKWEVKRTSSEKEQLLNIQHSE